MPTLSPDVRQRRFSCHTFRPISLDRNCRVISLETESLAEVQTSRKRLEIRGKRKEPRGETLGVRSQPVCAESADRSDKLPEQNTLRTCAPLHACEYFTSDSDQPQGFVGFREKRLDEIAVKRRIVRIPLGVREGHSSNSKHSRDS